MSTSASSRDPAEGDGGLPVAVRPQFHSDATSFFRFVLRGGLKELVTLGFYRFWLLTNIRRRLWAATSIDGDAFEYTGTGREVFVGYLIGFALLALAFSVYGALPTDEYEPFAGLAVLVFMLMLGQFAAYRARRYRLSRTVWRGVRFWMKSEAIKYAFDSVCLAGATLLTLGLANPWRIAYLERFKFRRTFYGDLPMRFEGKGSDLFKAGIWLWLLGVAALAAFCGVIAGTIAAVGFSSIFHAGKNGTFYLNPPLVVNLVFVAGLVYLAAAFLALWAAYQAVQWRWLLDGVRISEARFECALTRRRVAWLYFRFVRMAIIIAVPAAALLTANFAAIPWLEGWTVEKAVMGAAVIAVFAFVLIGAVQRTILLHDFWAAVVEATSVRGVEALGAARKGGKASDALMEGVVDGGLLDGYEMSAGF